MGIWINDSIDTIVKDVIIRGEHYLLEYSWSANFDLNYINELVNNKKWDELEAYITLLKLNDEIVSYRKI